MDPKVIILLKGNLIPVSTFIDAARDLYGILVELEKEISGSPNLIWSISELSSSSASLQTIPYLSREDDTDNREKIVSVFVHGMARIAYNPIQPDYFSDEALIRAKHLANLLNGNVDRIEIRGTIQGKLSDHISITQRIAAHVDELIGVRRVSLGSVEGKLELISIHGGTYFNIYDQLTGRRVKCICDREVLDKLTDHRNLGRRILVYGEIREDARRYPDSIKLETYRFLREREELPQIDNIRGILAQHSSGEGN